MNNQKQFQLIKTLEQVPIPYQKRPITDLFCTIFGLLYSLIIIILAICLFNYDHYFRVNFPMDSQGRLCGIDQSTKEYPYVYFANVPEINSRVCVRQCPKNNKTGLQCYPTSQIGCRFSNQKGFKVVYYQSQQQQTRSGYFCTPKQQNLKDAIFQNSKLKQREKIYKSLDVIKFAFFTCLGICFLYIACVQFLAKYVARVVLILTSLILIANIICIILYNEQQIGLKVFLGVILLCVLLLLITSVVRYRRTWRFFTIFLVHSTQLVKKRLISLLLIPIFVLILFAFSVIILFQATAFWSAGALVCEPKQNIYCDIQGVGLIVLTVFLAVQTLWGFSFIKSAFNFCISYQTISVNYVQTPSFCKSFKTLICKHFGSVVGGSFLFIFLGIFDFIHDVLKPKDEGSKDEESLYARIFNKACCCMFRLSDLIRQDCFSYIIITGNPYCNSARYTTYLASLSATKNQQQISRIYGLCANYLIIGIVVIISLFAYGQIQIQAVFIIIVLTFFTCNLFVSYHVDISQALQLSFLLEQELLKRGRQKIKNQNFFHNKIYGYVNQILQKPEPTFLQSLMY